MSNEKLVGLIKQGHIELMKDLYIQNAPLIKVLAMQTESDTQELDDAMQNAYFGLIEAVKGYDTGRGIMFMTYAAYHIKNAIRRRSLIYNRVPEYIQVKASTVKQIQNKLCFKLQRTPAAAELASAANLTIERCHFLLNASRPAASLETPLTNDLTISDAISDSSVDFENDIADADEQAYIAAAVRAAVNALPEQQRDIITMHFFEDMTYTDIAKIKGSTLQNIASIARAALRRLRHSSLTRRLAEADLYVNYYRHKGIQSFKSTWTSSTEQIVIDKERYYDLISCSGCDPKADFYGYTKVGQKLGG